VREDDGLAMSSRNKYLSGEQRTNALVLSRALDTARGLVMRGERRASEIRKVAVDMIEATPGALMDYVEIVHPETLRTIDTIDDRAVMALAVRFGPTRLIDNTELQCP
jgi:pantoate--beta-alanine ligase